MTRIIEDFVMANKIVEDPTYNAVIIGRRSSHELVLHVPALTLWYPAKDLVLVSYYAFRWLFSL